MDSYRIEKRAVVKIALADEEAEIGPVPAGGGGRRPEPELDRLSNIIKTFNEHFGTLFKDADRVVDRIEAGFHGFGRAGLSCSNPPAHSVRATYRPRRRFSSSSIVNWQSRPILLSNPGPMVSPT